MENIVITQDQRAVAIVLVHGQQPLEEAVAAALTQHWQDVLEQAAPQYPKMAETFIPNAKPRLVEDAIQRDVYGPPVGHHLHPDDPSGRTALCGVKILGVPAFGEFVTCTDCRTLRMADDAAPLPSP